MSGVGLPDLTGRVALVTGASDGVGRQIAKQLAGAGVEVLMPVRNRTKADRAVELIMDSHPDARLTLLDLDLANLNSVRALTSRLLDEGRALDLAILNAGVIMLGDEERYVTDDGFELHFQTNFLGHAVLTLGLLPLLRGGRLVSQLSIAARTLRFDPANPQLHHGYSALRAYGASKVALGCFTMELARRSAADNLGLTVHLCHPGIAPDTGIASPVREKRGNKPASRPLRAMTNTPAIAAQPALLASITLEEAPAFFAPSWPGQFAGPAKRTSIYRGLRDIELGELTWRWARAAAG